MSAMDMGLLRPRGRASLARLQGCRPEASYAWVLLLVQVVVTLAAGAGAFLAEYLKTRGKNLVAVAARRPSTRRTLAACRLSCAAGVPPCAWAEPSLYCASHKAVPMFIETSVPREVCVGVKSLLLGALSFDPRVCQMARPVPPDDEPSWRDGPDCFWSGPSSAQWSFG